MGFIDRLRREFSFIQGNILILMVSWVLMRFARPIPNTYYPLFVLKLGGTPFILGLIGFASSIALALVQFPGGYLADKHGRRRLIVTMTFWLAISYVFYALAPSWHFIMIGTVLGSLCMIYQPALRALNADSLPPEKRGMGFSITMAVGAVSIFSPLVAGFLYASYGLVQGVRVAYLMTVVLYLSAAIVRTKLSETLEVKTERIDFISALKSYPRAVKESLGALRLIPRNALYLFLIFTVGGTLFASFCWPFYTVYAIDVLHIEEFQWAFLLSLSFIVQFCSALPVGKFVDTWGRKKALIISNILFMIEMMLFINGDYLKVAIVFLIDGIGSPLMHTAYQSIMADLVPREHRGKVMGCTAFFDNVLASIGQLIGGFIYQSISPQLPFLLFLVSTIPTTVLTFLIIHEPRKREA